MAGRRLRRPCRARITNCSLSLLLSPPKQAQPGQGRGVFNYYFCLQHQRSASAPRNFCSEFLLGAAVELSSIPNNQTCQKQKNMTKNMHGLTSGIRSTDLTISLYQMTADMWPSNPAFLSIFYTPNTHAQPTDQSRHIRRFHRSRPPLIIGVAPLKNRLRLREAWSIPWV